MAPGEPRNRKALPEQLGPCDAPPGTGSPRVGLGASVVEAARETGGPRVPECARELLGGDTCLSPLPGGPGLVTGQTPSPGRAGSRLLLRSHPPRLHGPSPSPGLASLLCRGPGKDACVRRQLTRAPGAAGPTWLFVACARLDQYQFTGKRGAAFLLMNFPRAHWLLINPLKRV